MTTCVVGVVDRTRANCRRLNRWRAVRRHWPLATASSKTVFARSTGTVIACWSPPGCTDWCQLMRHIMPPRNREKSIPSWRKSRSPCRAPGLQIRSIDHPSTRQRGVTNVCPSIYAGAFLPQTARRRASLTDSLGWWPTTSPSGAHGSAVATANVAPWHPSHDAYERRHPTTHAHTTITPADPHDPDFTNRKTAAP